MTMKIKSKKRRYAHVSPLHFLWWLTDKHLLLFIALISMIQVFAVKVDGHWLEQLQRVNPGICCDKLLLSYSCVACVWCSGRAPALAASGCCQYKSTRGWLWPSGKQQSDSPREAAAQTCPVNTQKPLMRSVSPNKPMFEPFNRRAGSHDCGQFFGGSRLGDTLHLYCK